MKKLRTTGLCVSFCFITTYLFASGIEEISLQSAEFGRMMTRTGQTDSADAAYYNPGGVARLQDGFYVNLANQFYLKKYQHEYLGTEYTDNVPSLVIPYAYLVYKKSNWAAFAALNSIGGVGSADYPYGSYTTLQLLNSFGSGLMSSLGYTSNPFNADMSLLGAAYTVGFTAGGSYAINDVISIGAGARYVLSHSRIKGDVKWMQYDSTSTLHQFDIDLDYEEDARGISGIFGVNISPLKIINIGIKYQMNTIRNFKTNVKKKSITGESVTANALLSSMLPVNDGERNRRDVPAFIGGGIAYMLTTELKISCDFGYYFTRQSAREGGQRKYDNSIDGALSLEYAIIRQVKLSVGGGRVALNARKDNYTSAEDPNLNFWVVCGGAMIEVLPQLVFNVGLLKPIYDKENTSTGVKLRKEGWNILIGLQLKV